MLRESVLDLIELIYDAATDSLHWPAFLQAFVKATGGRNGSFSLGDERLHEFGLYCSHGLSPEEQDCYVTKYSWRDPWNQHAKAAPEGTITPTHVIWPEEEMVKSDFYRQFLCPRSLYYGVSAVVLRTEASTYVLSMMRSREEGPCGEAEIELLSALLPHLRRASLLNEELAGLRSQQAVFLRQIDALPRAFFITDDKGVLLFRNEAGKKLLLHGDGLQSESTRLTASTVREDERLHALIETVAAHPDGPPAQLNISRGSQMKPYRAMLMSLRTLDFGPFKRPRSTVSIMVMDPDGKQDIDAARIQQRFALTPSEARLTALLVDGRSLEDVAHELKITFETARTHLRRIFSKTSTNRQGELIARVLRSA